MSLPGVCVVCRNPVRWGGRTWRDRDGRGPRHHCPLDRDLCGAWMPYNRERCARRPGHRDSHRSRWSMDNACRMATGRGLAA
jgi:hypothetical protein